jgi:uncharacterized protein YfdQ (DUF2303 family)
VSQILPKGITRADPLPHGVTRLSSHPGGTAAAAAQLRANVQSANQMHLALGQQLTTAADWLMRTEPGKFSSLAAAAAALQAFRATL